MTGQKRPIWDFEDVGDNWARVDPAGVAPIIAVPTTAGTGSGGRPRLRHHQRETHQKKLIFHPKVQPSIVISDPGAHRRPAAEDHRRHRHGRASPTASRPIARPFYHPMAEGVAVEGMRLIKEWLPIAVKRRQEPDGARPDAVRRHHGRHRVPEGPRRHPLR